MFSSFPLLTVLLLSISYHSAIAQNTNATGMATPGSSPSISSLAGSLSTSCQTAATNLLTGDLGSCANIIGLASVISGSGSVVPPLATWISGICSADPCSNSSLTSAQQSLSSGCSSDIQSGSSIISGVNSLLTNYASFRNLICAQYVSNSTYCVPSLLQNVEKSTGQNLTLTTISSLLTGGWSGSALSRVPSSVYCNDCGHAVVTLSAPIAASVNASMTATMAAGNSTMEMPHNTTPANNSVSGACGASFNDGRVPPSVRIAAKGSPAAFNAQNSAAARESVSSIAMLFLTLASSLFYFA